MKPFASLNLLACLLACLFAFFGTLGFSAAQETLTPPVEGKVAAVPTEKTDREIELLIRRIIARSPSVQNAKAIVDSGVVFLDGPVASRKEADWLKALAGRLPLTIAVVDNLEVPAATFTNLTPVWSDIGRLAEKLKQHLPSLFFAGVFLLLSYFLSGFLNRGIRTLWGRRIQNSFLLVTVTRLTLLPIWLIFFYLALRFLGLPTLGATIVGGTSVLGIVIGLAFKGIAENYLAGLLLASRSPFTRGDLIHVGQYKGYVENLNMRGTTIIDLNGNLILIPNLTVIQSVVENQSANPHTRASFIVGIGYQDSISRAQDLIVKSLVSVEGVLSDPPPAVVVHELGSTRVELRVLVWFNVKEHRELRVRSRAMIQTKEILLLNGFNVPTEAREISFSSPLKIETVTSSQNVNPTVEERMSEVKRQAQSNLADTGSIQTNSDPSPEDMLKQAEKNPLPLNPSENALLKKPAPDVT